MAAISSLSYSYSALSYSSVSFSGPASRPADDDWHPGRGHGFGRDHGKGQVPEHGLGFGGPSRPSAMERAIDRIIDIILKMQDGNDEPDRQADVQEAGGNILSADGTAGSDTMTFSAISLFSLSAQSGNDRITIKAASVTSVSAGVGDDALGIAARFMTGINGGDGDDRMQMSGLFANEISGGAGNDIMTIAASAILGVTGGDGDDTMTLAGNRILVAGGAGNDIMTIDSKGDRPAELSFGRGDGQDRVNANGPINIRFTMTQFELGMTSSGGYGPDELSIAVSTLSIMIRSQDGKDSISISFAAGSLNASTPQWQFVQDKGDWLMKIS